MKRLLFLPLGVLFILCFVACHKGSTEVSGTVFEKGSGKGVANASVIFSECVPGDGTGASAICIDVATVQTNAKGEYTFAKDSGDATEYRIRAEKKNYGKPTEVFQTAEAGKCTEDINFTLPAFAWIKFHVKNVNPFDNDDRFAIFIFNSSSDGIFYGRKVDTTFIQGGFSGGYSNKFTYSVKKNNLYKQLTDSAYCKPLDTTFHEIKY